MAEDCKIIKDYGLIAKHGDVELRLRLVSWYGNEPKLDLRAWINNFGKGGMVLTKEQLANLKKLISDNSELINSYGSEKDEEISEYVEASQQITKELNKNNSKSLEQMVEAQAEKPKKKRGRPPKEKVEEVVEESAENDINNDVVEKLATLSVSDPEYMKTIAHAKPEEIDLAIKIMNSKKKVAKTVAKAETKGKRGRKAKESKPDEKKADVIQFPKPKPELEHKLVTDGKATYEECEARINKEREMFKDSDSEYVFVGLLELAKVDQDFRNNLMREDKSFTGAMEYMMKQVQAGYGYKKGQMGWCDKDLGLGFAIDYYNTDESAKTKGKAEKVETEEEGEEE